MNFIVPSVKMLVFDTHVETLATESDPRVWTSLVSFSAGSGPVPTRSGAVRGVSAPLLSEQAWSVLCLACWGRCAEGPHRSESGHREPLRLAGTSQGALAQLRLCVAAGALLAEQPAFSGGLLVVLPGTEGREPVILS